MKHIIKIVVAIALLAVSASAQGGGGVGTAALATVTPASAPIATVPATFMGYGIEWTEIAGLGTAAAGPNLPFRQLMANLTQYGAGPFNIRIGGNSTDTTCCAAQNVQPLVDLANATGAKFVLGIAMKPTAGATLTTATTQASAYVAAMPAGSLLACETGNEMNDYGLSASDAEALLSINGIGFVPTLKAICGNVEGPSVDEWRGGAMNLPGVFVTNVPLGMGIGSFHYYTDLAGKVAPGTLLVLSSAVTPHNEVPWYVPDIQMSHRIGVPIRINEMNTIAGGGQIGVSDAFESALWMISNLFQFVADGLDGVNIGGATAVSGSTGRAWGYNLFNTVETTGTPNTYSIVNVAPDFYGLQFFQEATPVVSGKGAQVWPVSMTVSTGQPSIVNAWMTVDGANNDRLILLNEDTMNAGPVAITESSCTSATAYYLTANTPTTGPIVSLSLVSGGTSGYSTATGVPTTTTSALGNNATLSLTASGGVITAATIYGAGELYAVGDTIKPTQSGSSGDASFSVASINTAPYTATAGIYLNGNGTAGTGQTYDGSTSGVMVGTASPATITPSAGVFSIPMATTQAAIVQFSPAGCAGSWL